MILAILAHDHQWNEIKNCHPQVDWLRIDSLSSIPINIDAIFILTEDYKMNFSVLSIPIFINSVSLTLKELNTEPNVVRINGWNSFLSRPNWEIAGIINDKVKEVLVAIDKKFTLVPDEPGLIAARILAMIINEAWFALGEGVTTKGEIDIAMKLGTNYPLGPFEWGELIGEKNIYALLKKLSANNKRYLPAQLLHQKISE